MEVADIISISKPSKFEDVDSDIEMSDGEEPRDNGIVTPGELVTDDPVWMKGHGTYFLKDNTYSSVAGNVSRVNRLLSVIPLRGKYQPETGDHVVGRITEVGNKRWKVDIGAKQDAVLMLGSVNLPGGVLRRKSESDELQMRNFLKEGDLLNAEVQTVFNNGSASLHTRSLKYGKLRNGIFLTVPSSLVIKSKNHSHDLPGDVSVILGVNGFVWLNKTNKSTSNSVVNNKLQSTIDSKGNYDPGKGSVSITRLEEESSWEIYSDKNDKISATVRDNITRYYNVIKALSHGELGITEQRINLGYQASLQFGNIGKLIEIESMENICQDIITNERMRGSM
ncbi:exosome complex component Rrp4p [[Candida] jaroonii]|uniref:Exosome complex component Rrp4p n=1 Tax=[Candida] jaroonii TaxID=467808 RepID=A0ACA9YEN1_9ASCO|nr:exosome complex component Rrp4p [[Candida] jaroonii]